MNGASATTVETRLASPSTAMRSVQTSPLAESENVVRTRSPGSGGEGSGGGGGGGGIVVVTA